MLPKLQFSKPDSYPKDTHTLNSSNILKLKLIQQFLEQKNTTDQREVKNKKGNLQGYDKENSHRRQNSTLVKCSNVMMKNQRKLGLGLGRKR